MVIIAGQTDFVMYVQFALYVTWQFSNEDDHKNYDYIAI